MQIKGGVGRKRAPAVAASLRVRRLHEQHPEGTGAWPSCNAVGGYEANMKRTGKVCRLY